LDFAGRKTALIGIGLRNNHHHLSQLVSRFLAHRQQDTAADFSVSANALETGVRTDFSHQDDHSPLINFHHLSDFTLYAVPPILSYHDMTFI